MIRDQSTRTHRANPRLRPRLRRCAHGRRQPGDCRSARGARRVGDGARSDRAVRANGARRVAGRQVRSGLQRADGPRHGDGRDSNEPANCRPPILARCAASARRRVWLRRGRSAVPHRVHVAWQSAEATVSYSCEFVKGKRTRGEEESLAAEMVLHAVAEACGVHEQFAPRAVCRRTRSTRREKRAPAEWTELLLGERPSVDDSPARRRAASSFSPARSIRCTPAIGGWSKSRPTRCGAPVTLELSIANVDKPTLDFLEIDARLAGLADYPVLLTRAATFAEKAALCRAPMFVVGADTIARIADEKYYDGDYKQRDSAIAASPPRVAGSWSLAAPSTAVSHCRRT